MPRPCSLCTNATKAKLAADLMAAGLTDQAIADQVGGMSRMAVARHRQNHILKPAQDRMAVISKGAAPREVRQQLAQAASADTPSPQAFVEALLGLKAQAEKLANIEARLERMAQLAEAAKSPNSVSQLAAQQLRSVEVGAKLAGIGSFAPARPAQDGTGPTFSVTINLGKDGQHSIVMAGPPLIEGEAAEVDWSE